MDEGVSIGQIYFLTDNNGVIKEYVELGDAVPTLPAQFRTAIADLLGETSIFLAMNKQSGNWGVAVSGKYDTIDISITKAMASCVSKDTGLPLSQLKTAEQIDAHNKNCKLAAVQPPRSLALFRNKLSNGQYEFHGAFSYTNTVPKGEYNKQESNCKTTGTDCRHIRTFTPKDAGSVF